MSPTRTLRRLAIHATTAVSALTWTGTGVAQNDTTQYPSEPVRVIVPYVAGGATDVIARVFSQALGTELKQSFVVENKPGGGQVIGTQFVARAPANGHIVLLGTVTHAINETLVKQLPYNAKEDFAFATVLASSPMVCVVPATVGIKTLDELVEAARKEPERYFYASSGAGSPGQLSVEAIKQAAGISLSHVPYKGAGQAVTDLVSGRVHFMCVSPIPISAQLQDGTLIPLAVTSNERTSVLPDVPTVRELGYEADTIESWYALVAPAGTPAPVLERLYQAAQVSLRDQQVQKVLQDNGLKPIVNSPSEADAYLVDEIAKWEKLIKAAGITLG